MTAATTAEELGLVPKNPAAANHTTVFGGRLLSNSQYGPDGMPIEAPEEEPPEEPQESYHHGVEIHDQGWFHAESNRGEQERLAREHFDAICVAVDAQYLSGQNQDCRWTNDPELFPNLRLRGSFTSNAVIPFQPDDRQYFIRGIYDPTTSALRETAVPNLAADLHGNSTWVRLIDFPSSADAAHLFDETSSKSHCGRILQGALDNGYFVEALQAVALRPKLVKQLFYCWDERRSVYVARIYKHGTWSRVELDDYVPVGAPAACSGDGGNVPICCRSEHFPYVLWPSLVEKAYAKVHTFRSSHHDILPEDRGGWEALGYGGRVEEALADLTGGVAGRFHTSCVTIDRLFVYLYELQRDTLFVCRPNQAVCETHGVRLNPYYPHAVNRAVCWEGRLFVQVFCGAPGIYDGGLQDMVIPFSLLQAEEYPEKSADGFFWMSAMDFHEYFGTIFECRLVNSGDVALPNMPPPRLPPMMPFPGFGSSVLGPPGMQHSAPDGRPLSWYEWVWCNPGEVKRSNEPEFLITIPENAIPCEIVCCVEQLDPRMFMESPKRNSTVPLLVKGYESVEGNRYFSKDLVCRSNWLPVRDAMVAFRMRKGCTVALVCEFPDEKSSTDRMIFRCYATHPEVVVTARSASVTHMLVEPIETPRALRQTFVGVMNLRDTEAVNKPQKLDEEHDCMRKPEYDMEIGLADLVKDVRNDCSLM